MVAVEGDFGWRLGGSFNFCRRAKTDVKRGVLFGFFVFSCVVLCSVLIVKLAERHVVVARQMNGAPAGHACLVIIEVPNDMVRVAANNAAIILRLACVEDNVTGLA
jgi:hypothetical protein